MTRRKRNTCTGYIGPRCLESCTRGMADCDDCELNRGCVDCVNPWFYKCPPAATKREEARLRALRGQRTVTV